jgi:hypothetical protein
LVPQVKVVAADVAMVLLALIVTVVVEPLLVELEELPAVSAENV